MECSQQALGPFHSALSRFLTWCTWGILANRTVNPSIEKAEDHTEVLNTGDDFKSGEPTALASWVYIYTV